MEFFVEWIFIRFRNFSGNIRGEFRRKLQKLTRSPGARPLFYLFSSMLHTVYLLTKLYKNLSLYLSCGFYVFENVRDPNVEKQNKPCRRIIFFMCYIRVYFQKPPPEERHSNEELWFYSFVFYSLQLWLVSFLTEFFTKPIVFLSNNFLWPV